MEAKGPALCGEHIQLGGDFVNELLFLLGVAGLVQHKSGLVSGEHHAGQKLDGLGPLNLGVVLLNVGTALLPEQLFALVQCLHEGVQQLYQPVQVIDKTHIVLPPRGAEINAALEVGNGHFHAVGHTLKQKELQGHGLARVGGPANHQMRGIPKVQHDRSHSGQAQEQDRVFLGE